MDSLNATHTPVLLEEVMADLALRPGGRFLDGTTGLGGHAAQILKLTPGAELCGLDRDAEALAVARERLSEYGDRVRLFHLPFAEYEDAMNELGWERVNGALLDLGVSSPQLDRAERGFSFREDARLDMRMDRSRGETAWDIVNRAPFDELKNIISSLGEEPMAARIARAIVDARRQGAVDSTTELAELVRRAYPPAWRRSARNHPATRVFQALRMATNDELGQLEKFLQTILQRLAPRGRLAIISFHSLEDRQVKRAMKKWAANGEATLIHKKPLTADESELAANPRARSAKLRACEKIDEKRQDSI